MSRPVRLTYADYLNADAASPLRHEWVDGGIVARAGGTPEHAHLIAEVGFWLRSALSEAVVYLDGPRLRVESEDATVYPDVQVICGPRRLSADDPMAVVNPVVVVEVLSDSTEAYDRGRKFELYEAVPSLRHYLLVSQGRRRIEHFARNDDGTWTRSVAGAGEVVRLAGLCELAVDQVYGPVEAARAAEVREG